MKIICVGGGPAGLCFAIATALLQPRHRITVVERRPAGTTYGWGIVYWDELLRGLQRFDSTLAREVRARSCRWGGQQVLVRHHPPVHLGGYGYGMSRHHLVDILVRRAQQLGVLVEFEHDAIDLAAVSDADLVVLSDGAGSRLRRSHTSRFGTVERIGTNKHIWLGTKRTFRNFTFAFEQTPAGWVWFHAYRHEHAASTMIVECSGETWKMLGLGALHMGAAHDQLADIFARHLEGHTLEDRSVATEQAGWTDFTTVSNARWHHENIVLLGDCARTTHFTTGLGTRLAFEDATALARAAAEARPANLEAMLRAYEDERRPVAAELQAAAACSAAWFEDADSYARLDPVDLGYSLRSRRDPRTVSGGEIRRYGMPYQVHLATQWAVGRVLRRTVAATRRRYWNAVRPTARP